jgi:hypothetical protein
MNEKEAILGLMMSERMKAALIAANNLLTFVEGLPTGERMGGKNTVSQYLSMLASELGVAQRVSPQDEWAAVAQSLERAQIKVDSGIPYEATRDLTEAISKTVTVSHRTMSMLVDKGLL